MEIHLVASAIYLVSIRKDASRSTHEYRWFRNENNFSPAGLGKLQLRTWRINRLYLQQGNLSVETMSRGYAWLDTGTHESMLEASQFIHTIENRQGLKVACPEEVAWRSAWIDDAQLKKMAQILAKSGYSQYLTGLLRDKVFA